jgi:ABC-type multidrug transport system fused ATPase/permease subunit
MKALVLGSGAKATFSTGQIMNLFANDIVHVQNMIQNFAEPFFGLPQLAAALALIYQEMQVSMFVGLGLIVCVVPIMAVAVFIMAVNRNHKIIEGDTRVKLTNEVLAGIRILRYMGWERAFEKKIDEAFQMTEQFLQNVNDPVGFRAIVEHGIQILVPKDAQLKNILRRGGEIHRFTEDYINGWKLPAMWFDLHVFIIDNTGITFDTTEAAHLAFEEYPHMNIFINYRKKYDRFSKKTTYTYSARSRDFDITEGTILKGHPNAAGATLVKGEHAILPFLLTPP